MACLYPIDAWYSQKLNENGKRPIVFKRSEGFEDMALQVPCGKCIGCMADRASSWAIRCYHESQFHQHNSFLTITYDDSNLPENLCKSDLQDFIRSIRNDYSPHRIKYYGCGEYGDKTRRPHYHLLVFGADFRDGKEIQFTETSYGSDYLQSKWKKGIIQVDDFTMGTACYVAGYVTKKIKKPFKDEFQIMSRGIGFDWLKKYWKDVKNINQITINGQKYPVPPAYIRYAEERMNNELQTVKRFRKKIAEQKTKKLGLDRFREYRAKEKHMVHSQEKKLRSEKI